MPRMMNQKTTLQNSLVSSLEAIASHATENPRLLNVCINALKAVKIPDNDHVTVLTFIKLLLDAEDPAVNQYNKPLIETFKFSRDKMEKLEQKLHTKNKLSKR